MRIRLFPEAIERRRQSYKECEWLSDWQVHSAHIAAGTISSLACEFETGPLYVPMPTGSGKTTGAIWGIVEFVKSYPDQRLCFLSPYKEAVNQVHAALVDYLGNNIVGMYHSDAFVDKDEELQKQVVILTHQFVEHNQGKLDDRDIFVIDEAIYATGEATLKLHHFGEALSWATRNGVLVEEFIKLHELANYLNKELHDSDKKYIAAPHQKDLGWANTIAHDLQLSDHSQTIDDSKVLVAVQRFCEALLSGLVFLSKGSIDSQRYDPVYSAAVLGIPRIDKTVILSATGGMVYDIAGPFKQDMGSREYWSPPNYQNLKLVQLSGPELTGHYRTWTSTAKKDTVQTYVDWLLSSIPESNVYITMPKQVLKGCLRNYFNLASRGEIQYPITINKHGKQINISHHARSVGSNNFKDCDAVIYLWDNYLPQAVAIQRFHTLADEEITVEALEQANGGHLVGNYKRIREAQYIDNMMQQIGRGRIRNIDEAALADKMTAYVLTDNADRFVRLAAQYTDCARDSLPYKYNEVVTPVGRIARILDYLHRHKSEKDISASELEEALGFQLRRYNSQLSNNWDIMMLGYEYIAGGRGRGNSATFIRIRKN